MQIRVTVPGEPVGKGRPRFTNGHAYTPKKTEECEEKIKLLYKLSAKGYKFPRHVPVDVRIKAYYTIPVSDSNRQHSRKRAGIIRPCKTPDVDNIGKIVFDALNKMAYEDDAQIVDFQIRKFYSDNPRIEILVQAAETKEESKNNE